MKNFHRLFFCVVGLLVCCTPLHAGPAADLMRQCEEVLCSERERSGLWDEALDPDRTGLIGVEFSPLTTSLGDLRDKRASTRPEMADALEDYLRRADVVAGDVIAVNASGSFPGYALAVLCAAEVNGIKVRMVFSYGSSMYGGTVPEFTFPVMLDLLNERGLLHTRLAAVAPGGGGDRMNERLLEDPWPVLRGLLDSRPETIIEERTVADAIKRRLEIFDAPPGPACFVSCGGPVVSMGTEQEDILTLGHGLLKRPPRLPQGPERGLIFEYLERGIPVIHLLFTRGICEEFSIPCDFSTIQ